MPISHSERPNDFYHFTMAAAHSVEIWLTNLPAGNDYDLYLYDAAHALVGYSGTIGGGNEHIYLPASLPKSTISASPDRGHQPDAAVFATGSVPVKAQGRSDSDTPPGTRGKY